jgi:hypothetical protein
MKKISPGALAALLVTALLAAPAHAAPGKVAVRIEGDAQTLLPRSVVTTTDAPVGKPGQPTCAGTSALGAVDRATGGDWAGTYFSGLGYNLETLEGETHDTATSSYWAFWINYTYASMGVCDQQVQEGHDLLFVPECYAPGCLPSSPLRLSGVAPTVAPGAPMTVKVEQYAQGPGGTTAVAPAAGATVAIGGATATTGGDGTAQLVFGGSGAQNVQATKPGHVRSATEATCVTTGSDGLCGSQTPQGPGSPTAPVSDKTAPVASFKRIRHGRVFKRRSAPRKIAGRVTPDPSGLKEVRLSIKRRVDGRCWRYHGTQERFKRRPCDGWRSFAIGDRAEWSYLLPRRLGKGRYAVRAVAVDKAGNDSVTRVVFWVR